MFARTNHLTMRTHNIEVLANDFTIPEDIENVRSVPIAIGRFFTEPDRFLRIDNDFGILEVYSEFFFRATGLEATSDLFMRFTLEDCEEIISFQLIDNNDGQVIDVQNPGRTALLQIPLSLWFMQGSNGQIHNAVEFIDNDGNNRGVLPRSFTDDYYLYININRSGRFRLVTTNHGNTSNIADFLNDRNIAINGIEYNDQRVVTRAEFYSALMNIHWVEQLHFDLRYIESFPDVPRGGALELQINTGQRLGVLVGFPDGYFRPNYPLMRRHMFLMLEGNISAFGFEIDNLMPAKPYTIGIPEYEPYWFYSMQFLKNRGFFPNRLYGDIPDIAADEHVTVDEAKEIIYRLIIADRLIR